MKFDKNWKNFTQERRKGTEQTFTCQKIFVNYEIKFQLNIRSEGQNFRMSMGGEWRYWKCFRAKSSRKAFTNDKVKVSDLPFGIPGAGSGFFV